MAARRRPRRVMTPITDKVRFPAFRSGRMELWSARSTDGLWTYERLEVPGTPWVVTYRPTGQEVWFGNLYAAREWTAGDPLTRLKVRAQEMIDRGGWNGEVGPVSDELRRERLALARWQLEVLANPPSTWVEENSTR